MVAAGWSEAQKRAYVVLADNQLAITGSGWDPELDGRAGADRSTAGEARGDG
jgi:hypothetical protein